jgi:predicted PurR-regulated permease PerM
MLPFLIEGTIRLLILSPHFTLDTFNSSTLAGTMGLLCLFINQNLLTHRVPLPELYEEDVVYRIATVFLTFAIFSFVLFAIIVALATVGERFSEVPKDLPNPFKWIMFSISPIPIIIAIFTQRDYNLKAAI